MPRLIDADKLKKSICDQNCEQCESYSPEDGGCTDISGTVLRIIDEQPTVDVQEVKWISVKDRQPANNDIYIVSRIWCSDGKPRTEIARWNGEDWMQNFREITPRVTHWMPMPKPPKED